MRNNKPIVVYHQNCRILDHYKQKIIDIIEDKDTNKIQKSYKYNSKEIGWMDNSLTNLSEANIIYHVENII